MMGHEWGLTPHISHPQELTLDIASIVHHPEDDCISRLQVLQSKERERDTLNTATFIITAAPGALSQSSRADRQARHAVEACFLLRTSSVTCEPLALAVIRGIVGPMPPCRSSQSAEESGVERRKIDHLF